MEWFQAFALGFFLGTWGMWSLWEARTVRRETEEFIRQSEERVSARIEGYWQGRAAHGVATDQPAGWHVSFDGGLTWEYHADDPWGRLGERVAIVRPLIYGDGADWRTAGVATDQPVQPCATERECDHQPWCRINGKCQRAAAGVKEEGSDG